MDGQFEGLKKEFNNLPTSVDAYAKKGGHVFSRDVDVVMESGLSRTRGYGAGRFSEDRLPVAVSLLPLGAIRHDNQEMAWLS